VIIKRVRKRFMETMDTRKMFDEEIVITCRALAQEEAIGNPLHDDYPIQRGRERMIEADFMGSKGQAFSDAWFNYRGTVGDILALNLETNARRAIFVCSLNAVMAGMGMIPPAVHCKDGDLTECADAFSRFAGRMFPRTDRFLLVGLQPRLLEKLTALKHVRVCDLNPENIGVPRCGIVVDGPERFAENAKWAETIIATGSSLVNGTIDEILAAGRETYFYGVTITGAACRFDLRQYCFTTGNI